MLPFLVKKKICELLLISKIDIKLDFEEIGGILKQYVLHW